MLLLFSEVTINAGNTRRSYTMLRYTYRDLSVLVCLKVRATQVAGLSYGVV